MSTLETTDRRYARLPLFGLAGALALLGAVGLAMYRDTIEQQRAALLVEHTHLVLESLQQITGGLSTAESELRGYGIEHDEEILRDFEAGILEAEHGLGAARELTQDNPAQHEKALALEPKVARRVVLLRDRLAATRAGGEVHISPEARRLGAEIRAAARELETGELRLLGERTALRETRIQRLRATVVVGVVLSGVLVGLAFLLFWLEVRQRRRAEEASSAQGERLKELVKESGLMLQLGEMLGACRSVEEANGVVERFAPSFFPRGSGAVCMLNESQNLLEVNAQWGERRLVASATYAPEECWALRRGKSHRSEDAATGVRCVHLGADAAGALCVPLLANGQVIGALHVEETPSEAERAQRLALMSGEQIALALSNLRLRETLRNQSIRDPLTSLFNRRYTDETLTREIHRARRESSFVSVLVMDVDFFKKFNDTFGHQAGDRVLCALGSLLRQKTRGSDVASRMGGEELAILLPGTPLDVATRRAEDIRDAVSKLDVLHEGKNIGPVTLSVGVATFPSHGTSGTEILHAADVALYRAKREGRNRVIVADGGA